MDQLANVIADDIRARSEALGRARGILQVIANTAERGEVSEFTLALIRDHALQGLQILNPQERP